MKKKSFISKADHFHFIEMIENFISSRPHIRIEKGELYLELMEQHQHIESVFIQYMHQFNELNRLIGEYEMHEIKAKRALKKLQISSKSVSSIEL